MIHPNDSKCAITALNIAKIKAPKMLDLQTKSSIQNMYYLLYMESESGLK
jgi:hypothetical protein